MIGRGLKIWIGDVELIKDGVCGNLAKRQSEIFINGYAAKDIGVGVRTENKQRFNGGAGVNAVADETKNGITQLNVDEPVAGTDENAFLLSGNCCEQNHYEKNNDVWNLTIHVLVTSVDAGIL